MTELDADWAMVFSTFNLLFSVSVHGDMQTSVKPVTQHVDPNFCCLGWGETSLSVRSVLCRALPQGSLFLSSQYSHLTSWTYFHSQERTSRHGLCLGHFSIRECSCLASSTDRNTFLPELPYQQAVWYSVPNITQIQMFLLQ